MSYLVPGLVLYPRGVECDNGMFDLSNINHLSIFLEGVGRRWVVCLVDRRSTMLNQSWRYHDRDLEQYILTAYTVRSTREACMFYCNLCAVVSAGTYCKALLGGGTLHK